MKNLLKNAVMFLLIAVSIAACTRKTEYDKMVEKELATNVRYDSLFLGIRLDMTRKEFYGHCWELNKQGVFSQGPGNLSVLYNLPEELSFEGFMQFYPQFVDNHIYEMPIEFKYKSWAPWNKEMNNDKLLADVKALLEKWYDGEFVKIVSNDGKKSVLVKVDGNRRIRIFKKDLSTVRVVMTDLLVLEEMKKNS